MNCPNEASLELPWTTKLKINLDINTESPWLNNKQIATETQKARKTILCVLRAFVVNPLILTRKP